MRRPGRLAASLAAVAAFAAVSCTSGTGVVPPSSPRTSSSPAGSPTAVPTGRTSAAKALARLCRGFEFPDRTPVRPTGQTPPAIAEVQRRVEEVRGLRFRRSVAVRPVTQAELVERLSGFLRGQFPATFYGRRTRAWQTIGVIPPDITITEAQRNFFSGQVIGFYVPATGELYFIGTDDPSAFERVVLAHELTHAIDDQHFDLDRLDPLAARCSDEEVMAATGVVEGSAQFFAVRAARELLSIGDLAEIALSGSGQPSPEEVPPFIYRTAVWPYVAGRAFVTRLEARGGLAAVNRALQDFPVSTEQVIHPEKYPGDVPTPVDVADLSDALGDGWRDLDVMDVGEEWLTEMLALRLEREAADGAAAGWDGGLYRAWWDGQDVAVVLTTVWDSEGEAAEFAPAMRSWIARGSGHAFLESSGTWVTVGFASRAMTLAALEQAFGDR